MHARCVVSELMIIKYCFREMATTTNCNGSSAAIDVKDNINIPIMTTACNTKLSLQF